MSVDEIDIDSIAKRKTALFIIVSDTDSTFNFIAAILYSQLFNRLCEIADDKYGGSLPYQVRILADEFPNIGKIPGFEKLIATIRSRGISISIILQTLGQLKALYKDADQIITGNCDSFLFLGGKEESTLKSISRSLGKETIDYNNGSETRGSSTSHSKSTQHTGRSLMTEDELSVMDGGRCILQIRGVRPFFSDKYDIKSHPGYKELLEYDRKKNAFDPKSYVSCRCRISKAETFKVLTVMEASTGAVHEDHSLNEMEQQSNVTDSSDMKYLVDGRSVYDNDIDKDTDSSNDTGGCFEGICSVGEDIGR